MSASVPEGYYLDIDGELQQDRRSTSNERREPRPDAYDGDRRSRRRRKTDLNLRKREADRQIEEALDTFAEEHNQ